MNRICRNHCYATDKPVLRCPRCGELLVNTSMSQQEITEETKARQVANRGEFLNDTRRIDNSRMREAKRYYDQEEIRFNRK